MSKKRKQNTDAYLFNHPGTLLIIAVAAIIFGIFFITLQSDNTPITRAEAVAYSGSFDHYDCKFEDYRFIRFQDGTEYSVYPHTETSEFKERMQKLEEGTKLYILVNPNNECVIEVKTDSEELLNFEASQQDIASYDNGYVAIGLVAVFCGVCLIILYIYSKTYKKKESARHKKIKAGGDNRTPLRDADPFTKSRILLKATVEGYNICYRRVKSTNELVINDMIYDEKKGIIEFAHKLCATVDGHTIEAGLDNDSYSYITFDGELIKTKERKI